MKASLYRTLDALSRGRRLGMLQTDPQELVSRLPNLCAAQLYGFNLSVCGHFIVTLKARLISMEKFCSYGMFQLVGYHYCHAVAAIDYHRLKMEDFIDECFKKEVYLKVYNHMIHLVLEMNDFEDSKMGRVDPPDVIIKMGRPKKCRRNEANDNLNEGRQRSRTSHGASRSRRPSTPPLPPLEENETIQLEVPPIVSQPSQDSQPQLPLQPHFPVQPHVPAHDPPSQTATRKPFNTSNADFRLVFDDVIAFVIWMTSLLPSSSFPAGIP
ncbi:hypothetical protein Sango_2326200 [Sesamum angolense]|uniref:Uncharacterized protein n=1 Tax=Sesamum angolense TaxID=2727404 RepID=A0AAE1WAT6_9LAMI|nr:hypothetical protein Sango_2326200 [Sesamum angolense]